MHFITLQHETHMPISFFFYNRQIFILSISSEHREFILPNIYLFVISVIIIIVYSYPWHTIRTQNERIYKNVLVIYEYHYETTQTLTKLTGRLMNSFGNTKHEQ